MASSHGSAHSDTAKMEQIISEFFAKSLHIILESRALHVSSRDSYGDRAVSSPCSSSSSSSYSVRPRDKWFNLALRECPAALENIDLLRQNNLESIIIDVVLVQRPQKELGVEAKSEKIVERWIVQCERRKIRDSNSGSKRSSNISLHNLYKKSTLLLRSLYATVRLLPAYKVFRDLNSCAQIRAFTLAHRVSSFVEPFTRKEEAEMLKFGFTPVDTSSGRLCLTVMYCPSASALSSEPLTSLSPQVITDYVGSPLADPLKRFPTLPLIQKKDTSFDDYYHPSPSPSIYNSGLLASKTPLQSESAPVSIPNSEVANSPGYSGRHNFPPSPPLRGSRCTSKIDRSTNAMQTGATAEKLFSLGKDEPQKYSGARISANSSPQISISRSSSRSYQDDFDDTDFSCPFDVDDDDDITDPGSRAESLDHGHMAEALEAGGFFPIRKSHDAAVGALVHMLKKAPPLHQDLYSSKHSSLCRGPYLTTTPGLKVSLTSPPADIPGQKPKKEHLSHGARRETWNNNIREPNQILEAPRPGSIMSSGIITTRKTTSDALEEFHGYREMKNLLLMRDTKPRI